MNQLQEAPVGTNLSISVSKDIEEVMIGGDLAPLNPQQRMEYVAAVCQSIGLNPLTRPFDYIKLNGKLTLYARKDATDQLRRLYGISVTKVEEIQVGGATVFITHVQDAEGRTDQGRAAMVLDNLNGDALCNAIMKLETKSKRRATLAICGLGFLDETELDSVDTQPKNVDLPQSETPKWQSEQPDSIDIEAEPVDEDGNEIEIKTFLDSNGFTIDQFNAAVAEMTKGEFADWKDLPPDRQANLVTDKSLTIIQGVIEKGGPNE